MVKICKSSMKYKEIKEYLESNDIEYIEDDCVGRCDLCHREILFYIENDRAVIIEETE